MKRYYSLEEAKLPIVLLNAPIEKLPNIGARLLNNFKQLEIKSVAELISLINNQDQRLAIFGYKSRKEIRTLLADIAELPAHW